MCSDVPPVLLAGFFGNQVFEGPVTHLLAAPAEDFLGRRIEDHDGATLVDRDHAVFAGCDYRAKLLFAFTQRDLHSFAVGDVTNRFDRPQEPALLVAEDGCRNPDVGPPATKQLGQERFRIQLISLLADVIVLGQTLRVGIAEQIDKDRSILPVKGNRIGPVPASKHLSLRNARHFFQGTIPGGDLAILVNDKCSIRKKVDDIFELPVGCQQGFVAAPCTRRVARPCCGRHAHALHVSE